MYFIGVILHVCVFPSISFICALSCISRAFSLHFCGGQGSSTRAGIYQPSSTLTWFAYLCIYILYLCIIICLVFCLYFLSNICIYMLSLFLLSPGFNNLSANSCVWSGCTNCSLGCFCVFPRTKYEYRRNYFHFSHKIFCICLIISYIFMSAPAGYQW